MIKLGLGTWMLWGGVLLTGCGPWNESAPGSPPKADANGGAASNGGEGQAGNPAKPSAPDSPADPVLTGAALAAEIERIAGTSFNVVNAPRPANEDWSCYLDEGKADGDSLEPRIEATFHFQKTDSGQLEAIVSVREPWLHVERAELTPSAGGFRFSSPPVVGACLHSGFEEALALELSIPAELELAFRGRDDAGRPTELALQAHFDGRDDPYEASGDRDEARPSIEEAPRYVHDARYDEYFQEVVLSWRLPRRFQFSEAMRPGWTVAIANDQQERFVLAQGDTGYGSTFDVSAYFPAGFRWLLEGEDLAGNPVQAAGEFPSFGPELSDGELESAISVGILCNGGHESYRTTDCVEDDFDCSLETAAPLAGERSLALEGCQGFLRIARTPNASALHLLARVEMGSFPQLQLGVRSLDTGSERGFDEQVFEKWDVDETTAGAYAQRSLPVALSVPLPPGNSDVLVSIAGYEHGLVWVDSLRTE